MRLCVDALLQPIMAILGQAAGNVAGTQALMSMIIVTSIVAYFNAIASVWRLTWAFGKFSLADSPGCTNNESYSS